MSTRAAFLRIARSSPFRGNIQSRMMSEGPITTKIRRKLESDYQPQHLQVLNESGAHNVAKGSETHFKVIVVSDKFEGLPLIQRHRMIHDTLKEELEVDGVHALSITSKTLAQWEGSHTLKDSPKCLGGMVKERQNK